MIDHHTQNNRRSIRLKGYDYSQAGAYFVTICTQNRQCLFGNIVDGRMVLNDGGKMVEKWYHELENKFHDIQCGEMVIMPNHIHFIIKNTVRADLRVCPNNDTFCPDDGGNEKGEHIGSPLRVVIQWFKTMTTNEYIRGVKSLNWARFDKRFWQRNYYEHIIRNENDYNRVTKYIHENPAKWHNDQLKINNTNQHTNETK